MGGGRAVHLFCWISFCFRNMGRRNHPFWICVCGTFPQLLLFELLQFIEVSLPHLIVLSRCWNLLKAGDFLIQTLYMFRKNMYIFPYSRHIYTRTCMYTFICVRTYIYIIYAYVIHEIEYISLPSAIVLITRRCRSPPGRDLQPCVAATRCSTTTGAGEVNHKNLTRWSAMKWRFFVMFAKTKLLQQVIGMIFAMVVNHNSFMYTKTKQQFFKSCRFECDEGLFWPHLLGRIYVKKTDVRSDDV